jgi:hypothetical protein
LLILVSRPFLAVLFHFSFSFSFFSFEFGLLFLYFYFFCAQDEGRKGEEPVKVGLVVEALGEAAGMVAARGSALPGPRSTPFHPVCFRFLPQDPLPRYTHVPPFWCLFFFDRYHSIAFPSSSDSQMPHLIKSKNNVTIWRTGDGTVEGWGDVWRLGRLTAGFPARLQDLLDETDKVPPA